MTGVSDLYKPPVPGDRRVNWRLARDILGVGTTKFYEMVNSGELKAKRVGKRGLIIWLSDVHVCMKDVSE